MKYEDSTTTTGSITNSNESSYQEEINYLAEHGEQSTAQRQQRHTLLSTSVRFEVDPEGINITVNLSW